MVRGGVRTSPVGGRSGRVIRQRTDASTVVAERRELLRRTELVVRDLQPRVPAGVVIACMVRCTDELVRSGVRSGLADAAEAMVRVRLAPSRELVLTG